MRACVTIHTAFAQDDAYMRDGAPPSFAYGRRFKFCIDDMRGATATIAVMPQARASYSSHRQRAPQLPCHCWTIRSWSASPGSQNINSSGHFDYSHRRQLVKGRHFALAVFTSDQFIFVQQGMKMPLPPISATTRWKIMRGYTQAIPKMSAY